MNQIYSFHYNIIDKWLLILHYMRVCARVTGCALCGITFHSINNASRYQSEHSIKTYAYLFSSYNTFEKIPHSQLLLHSKRFSTCKFSVGMDLCTHSVCARNLYDTVLHIFFTLEFILRFGQAIE